MLNKLGHYIHKRICKDQKRMAKKRPMSMYGLYIQPKDIQDILKITLLLALTIWETII